MRAWGIFVRLASPFGHRVLKTMRDAAGFEKNLGSEFVNEKRIALATSFTPGAMRLE
jgi:hypothetical protein